MKLNPTDIFNTLRLLGVSEGEKGLKEEEMVQLAIEVKYVSRPQQLLKYICCLPTTTEKRRTISSTFSLNGQNGKGEKKGWVPLAHMEQSGWWIWSQMCRLSTVDSVRFCSPLCGWSAVSVSGLVVPPHHRITHITRSLLIVEPSPGLHLSRGFVISA